MTEEILKKGYDLENRIHCLELSMENVKSAKSDYKSYIVIRNKSTCDDIGLIEDDYMKVLDLCEYLLQKRIDSAKEAFEKL